MAESEQDDGGFEVLEVPKSYADVRWQGEPAATDVSAYGNFVLKPDSDGQHVADVAMHDAALQGMQAAGLSATQGRFFYDLARDAHLNAPNTDRAAAEAQLRATWGGRYDANLSSVTALVDKAAKAWPGVHDYLRTSGLGNSAVFWISAARLSRRE